MSPSSVNKPFIWRYIYFDVAKMTIYLFIKIYFLKVGAKRMNQKKKVYILWKFYRIGLCKRNRQNIENLAILPPFRCVCCLPNHLFFILWVVLSRVSISSTTGARLYYLFGIQIFFKSSVIYLIETELNRDGIVSKVLWFFINWD